MCILLKITSLTHPCSHHAICQPSTQHDASEIYCNVVSHAQHAGAKNPETVCRRVFEHGLKKNAADPQYVLRYLEHLFNKTDQSNTRVLFERVLEEMEAPQARPIWDRFHAFETLYGDLTQVSPCI